MNYPNLDHKSIRSMAHDISPMASIAASSAKTGENTTEAVAQLKILDTGFMETTDLLLKLNNETEKHTVALMHLLQKEEAILMRMQATLLSRLAAFLTGLKSWFHRHVCCMLNLQEDRAD